MKRIDHNTPHSRRSAHTQYSLSPYQRLLSYRSSLSSVFHGRHFNQLSTSGHKLQHIHTREIVSYATIISAILPLICPNTFVVHHCTEKIMNRRILLITNDRPGLYLQSQRRGRSFIICIVRYKIPRICPRFLSFIFESSSFPCGAAANATIRRNEI